MNIFRIYLKAKGQDTTSIQGPSGFVLYVIAADASIAVDLCRNENHDIYDSHLLWSVRLIASSNTPSAKCFIQCEDDDQQIDL